MNPSSTPGHARRAPISRHSSFFIYALVLTFACSHTREGHIAKPAEIREPAPANPASTAAPNAVPTVAAAPSAASALSDAREGGTGTRAKGEEGALRNGRRDGSRAAPAPQAEANKPKRSASATGYGAGLGGLGISAHMSAGGSVGGAHRRVLAPATGALVQARPAPPEANTETYAPIAENAFVAVKEHPLSTFSSDVDTASYSNGRRFLDDGQLPPKDAVRAEEWVNYFSYGYAAPAGDAPVAIHTEVSACPWAPTHRLVRIGVKARPIEQAAVPPRNLVFLIDVSGSMQPANKLPLLRNGLAMLTRQLRPQDSVAMVVYAGSSGLVLSATPGSEQNKILGALAKLEAGGSTNGGEGIELAYKVAQEHFIQGGINRVVLATDGDFNVGTTSEGDLTRLIEAKRKTGVFLTVLGFGEGNVKDSTMEMLADKGNGNYAYIDSVAEARKVLVREAGATLVTVAKDVKLQTEFNPARVQSYRLIGYENRLLADQDFNDDKKDAGDMGAGHAVTALYEVVPVGVAKPAGQAPAVSPLKYQTGGELAPAASTAELLTVAVRYKHPTSNTSAKISQTVVDSATPFAQASADHRFAVAVAEVAQILHGSTALGALTLADAKSAAQSALGGDTTGDRRQLVALIDRASALKQGEPFTQAP